MTVEPVIRIVQKSVEGLDITFQIEHSNSEELSFLANHAQRMGALVTICPASGFVYARVPMGLEAGQSAQFTAAMERFGRVLRFVRIDHHK